MSVQRGERVWAVERMHAGPPNTRHCRRARLFRIPPFSSTFTPLHLSRLYLTPSPPQLPAPPPYHHSIVQHGLLTSSFGPVQSRAVLQRREHKQSSARSYQRVCESPLSMLLGTCLSTHHVLTVFLLVFIGCLARLVYMEEEDGLMHFYWKNRASTAADDVRYHPRLWSLGLIFHLQGRRRQGERGGRERRVIWINCSPKNRL